MIKMMTAYTTEVDEIEDGINEIFSQINLDDLKKHSVGLIVCHYDFTQTGFIEELQKKLPFETIGMTTMANGNNHGFSMYSLALTILTSDDVSFETAMSQPLGPENYTEQINSVYSQVSQKQNNAIPSMIITFFPILDTLSGAVMLNALDRAAAGVPIWGGLASNFNVSEERHHVFYNGKTGQNAMVILLLHGAINPEFVMISIPEQKIGETRGVITESEGCLLKKINQQPALKYLESIGILLMENAPTVIPFMVYYEGSVEPVALGVYAINEDGSLLCGGEMTEGAAIAAGEIDSQGIISTAGEGMRKLFQTGEKNGALILPCVTRYVMLSPEMDRELELISRAVDGKIPFLMGYSGGEICPVKDESGKLQNRFHNYTFSACIF